MTVVDGAVLRVSVRFHSDTYGDIMNVWHFRADFPDLDQPDENVMDAITAVMTASYQNIDQLMGSVIDPLDVKVDVVQHLAGKWTVVQNVGLSGWDAGLVTNEGADLLPPGSAILGKLRTGLGKHWGRKYFGGFTETSNEVGLVTAAAQTAVLALLDGLLDPVVVFVNDVLHTVVLDQLNGTVRDFVESAVNNVWSYQRRRRTGVGS